MTKITVSLADSRITCYAVINLGPNSISFYVKTLDFEVISFYKNLYETNLSQLVVKLVKSGTNNELAIYFSRIALLRKNVYPALSLKNLNLLVWHKTTISDILKEIVVCMYMKWLLFLLLSLYRSVSVSDRRGTPLGIQTAWCALSTRTA